MTPLQKSFAAFVESYKTACLALGGAWVENPSVDDWHCFDFQTRFGGLRSTVSPLDYESHMKRGFVSIYLRFNHDVDAAKVAPYVDGDFNRFSGKWNIHYSGDKKDLEPARQLALNTLKKRIEAVR